MEMHLIIGHVTFHTQIVSLILLRHNMDFIPNNSIYNNEHKCVCTIWLSESEKLGGGNAQQ